MDSDNEIITRDHEEYDKIDIPSDLIGSTIIEFTRLGNEYEGGGLRINYKSPDGVIKDAIFEFNEMGMWASVRDI